MNNKRIINSELMEKAEKIRKKMRENGEDYHGVDELKEDEREILGPRNDIEYQRLIKDIKEQQDDE